MTLDLRAPEFHLTTSNIRTFARKREAIAECRRMMLPTYHITEAANRFWAFWVINRTEPDGTWTVLTKTGEWAPFDHPGFLTSNPERNIITA